MDADKVIALSKLGKSLSVFQLEVMSIVREVQSTIRLMLSRREFITALDLISTATQLLHTDLTAVRSFRYRRQCNRYYQYRKEYFSWKVARYLQARNFHLIN